MATTSGKKLKILVTPLNGMGHVNACHGLCEELRERGHEIVFVLDKSFAGRVARYGFRERLLESPKSSSINAELGFDEDKDFWGQFVAKNGHRYERQTPRQLYAGIIPVMFDVMFRLQNSFADQYRRAVDEERPDLIVHDAYICLPPIVNAGIPWIWLFSATPHAMLLDERIPPPGSGLPQNGDRREWTEFSREIKKNLESVLRSINENNLSNGGVDLGGRMHPFSEFLNLYMMPRELRYPELTGLPDNIVALDHLMRTQAEERFELPAALRERSGKLVFFSMGSFGCANRSMMMRIVAMLAKSPHRFIVSKGPLQYDLPGENCWGEPYLPQTAILPIVDLVVTHGGNNTVTETFYAGVPMLVMPIFLDQFDNAQRITEMGLGARLDPHRCTEQELLGTIDRLLADDSLREKMREIGKRMRASTDQKMVADLIESKLAKIKSKN